VVERVVECEVKEDDVDRVSAKREMQFISMTEASRGRGVGPSPF
jgi:hypothetical protein